MIGNRENGKLLTENLTHYLPRYIIFLHDYFNSNEGLLEV